MKPWSRTRSIRIALVGPALVAALLVAPLSPPGASASTSAASVGYESSSARSSETLTVSGNGSWRIAITARGASVTRREPGGMTWTRVVDGPFRVPIVTTRGLRAGPSDDGRSMVLVRLSSTEATRTTTFAVVTKEVTRRVQLDGTWTFDAVSPDGRRFFAAESVGNGRYLIRPVDVTTGRPGVPVVGKTISAAAGIGSPEEGPMEGLPLDRLVSPDSPFVFTLYDAPGHPFVHALSPANGGTFCFDLPAAMADIAGELTLRRSSVAASFEVWHGREALARGSLASGSSAPSLVLVGSPPAPAMAVAKSS
jgi:hypothetical protein